MPFTSKHQSTIYQKVLQYFRKSSGAHNIDEVYDKLDEFAKDKLNEEEKDLVSRYLTVVFADAGFVHNENN